MNQKDLELKIVGLEKAIKEHNEFSTTYQNDLKSTQKQLDDYNKPELTPQQIDAIHNAVENYDFDNRDQYEIDFSIDYDGRIQAENINLTDTYELVEAIVTNVEKQFKIEQDEETND